VFRVSGQPAASDGGTERQCRNQAGAAETPARVPWGRPVVLRRIRGPSDPAVAPLPAIGPGSFTVTRYGAVGDGETDDTKALQAALAAAESSGAVLTVLPTLPANTCSPLGRLESLEHGLGFGVRQRRGLHAASIASAARLRRRYRRTSCRCHRAFPDRRQRERTLTGSFRPVAARAGAAKRTDLRVRHTCRCGRRSRR
jgi:hypothetical protein